jgi:stalled ribosome rescue protein Dom34
MKEQQPTQYAGIWMDHHQTILITPQDGEFAIQQKIIADEYHGHSGEHGAMNAEKADNRKYFKTISNLITRYDEVLIFGPGKSQEEFLNFLQGDQHFKGKKITLDTSGHVTDPQMIARVRDFFKA